MGNAANGRRLVLLGLLTAAGHQAAARQDAA